MPVQWAPMRFSRPKPRSFSAVQSSLRVGGGEEVEAADGGVQGRGAHDLARVLDGVDDAGVAAAGEHHQAAGGVHHQRLVFRDVVLDDALRGLAPGPVPLQLRSGWTRGTGPVSQTPGRSWTGPSCSTKMPPVASYWRRISIMGLPSRPSVAGRLQKMPLPTWTRLKARGFLRAQLAAQGHQAAGVVLVVVAQHHVVDAGEVEAQLARVVEDGARTRAGVEQDPPAVDFDQGGEAPLADARVGEHGREHDDAKTGDARRAAVRPWRRRPRRATGRGEGLERAGLVPASSALFPDAKTEAPGFERRVAARGRDGQATTRPARNGTRRSEGRGGSRRRTVGASPAVRPW